MSIKLAQIERALVTDNMLQYSKPHLDRRQRAVIVLRLEYFERMAVRLQYHKNDLVNYGVDEGPLKKFCEMASDILLLASLWRPFQHNDMEDGLDAVCGIEAFLQLYDAAMGLLDDDFAVAAAYLAEAKKLRKPRGFGARSYGGYDEYIKAIMENVK
nr:MAG TPA: hypothetical protein [Caudoviricetes sp.]